VAENPDMKPRKSTLINIGRRLLAFALLVGGYYVVPIEPGASGTQLVVRTVVTVVMGVLVTWLILREVGHQMAEPGQAPLARLLGALVLGVIFFALADYITAVSDQGQFASLETKTDGLYFAVATLSTVGYGDVHATGQIARALVTVQIVFNLLVIATAVSVLSRQVTERARERLRPPR
jgi:voltage-gated potassium channel